jgi:hypothetical protein
MMISPATADERNVGFYLPSVDPSYDSVRCIRGSG